MCRSGLHKSLFGMRVSLVKVGISAARHFLANTLPKHAVEPRDCPCRPRTPQRVRVRVTFGLGLGWSSGSGWSGPTCKVEFDITRPAQSFVQAAPAHSGSLSNPMTQAYNEYYSKRRMLRQGSHLHAVVYIAPKKLVFEES